VPRPSVSWSKKKHKTHSNVQTRVTLSSEDSSSDGEVQSTPKGFVPTKPLVGMVFESHEAALANYRTHWFLS
jgi:hypothetical protein